MADLLVRGVDDEIVRALKERAGAHGRSAEAEHRAILSAALARPRRRTFAEVLASMPDVVLTRISNESTRPNSLRMYLIDTNVISEARKQAKANHGVTAFFETVAAS